MSKENKGLFPTIGHMFHMLFCQKNSTGILKGSLSSYFDYSKNKERNTLLKRLFPLRRDEYLAASTPYECHYNEPDL